ncbi:succinate dehydrogenase, cytochrome b556 subunit [Segniliparus rotundus DSM 44985]|uniref:Succinate dehydrogenase, cytochrome b556 subunit n=1 Tax=Segniliparus rotundus (strain ATCC BAA-972 / CDC 1076 / CIP 108378 / DSM 44985 / JCM 13578) TaxID=640132 RepID=D6Z9T6_SEGRD|nr:succinate dehydrogenase, cytochrome b556 subunit [Segniliparus rotundus]ADG98606.1 succinate dehydrogenase, cytochrome b556 subunit [Segniliparus rotundus DSM 44985]
MAVSTRSLYRGDPGMWSWVLHRFTGVAIFFFLFVHVLDTAIIQISPNLYNQVIETYKSPVFGVLEIGLFGAVLFHALNGLRVVLVDFWSKGPRYQRTMLWAVGAVWVGVFAAAGGVMFYILVRSIK